MLTWRHTVILMRILGAFCLLLTANISSAGSLAAGAPELLADGFELTEGPIADRHGNVYFCDIPNNRIHRWTLEGELELFRTDTGGAAGLFFDDQQRLYAAEGDNARITRMDEHAGVEVMVDQHDGRPFNSPNDLWVDPDGGVYFTDPRYGDVSSLPQAGHFVYYLAPGADAARPIITDLESPNGIIGTPDGDTLFVADFRGERTWAYSIESPGVVASRRLAVDRGSDGISLDVRGNLYLTDERNVSIHDSRSGELLEQIELPERVFNMTFGGADRKTLFVAARTGLYSVPMNVRGAY